MESRGCCGEATSYYHKADNDGTVGIRKENESCPIFIDWRWVEK